MVSGSKLRDEVALRYEKYYRVGVAGARLEESVATDGAGAGGAMVDARNNCC